MCGIAGYAGGYVPGLMGRMNAAQAHRGPDGSGVFEDPDAEVALGHVRLAILDLTDRAAQPMHSPDGRYVISYSGETYNFRELRQALIKRGCTFRSTGDVEVVLQGLAVFGEGFIRKLNGMFAFALWDRTERSLLLARDPLGVKPLYYAEPEPDTLVFASEIKALCAHPAMRREPDFDVLHQHLAFCHSTGEQTALKGVRRLPPGSYLRWDATRRSCRVHRYWEPRFEPRTTRSRQQATTDLKDMIGESVRRQLVSDVPVGAYLSGGLDSTLLTTIASAAVGREFRCYTVTYPASENVLDRFDLDAPHARSVAQGLGLDLRQKEIEPSVAELWPKLVWHLDEPIADPAAIACYLISRLAREDGTPVLLSGQGADELFAGYPRHVAMWAIERIGWLPAFVRRALPRMSRLLPGAMSGRVGALLRRTRRVLQDSDRPADERFLSYCCSTAGHRVNGILSPDLRESLRSGPLEQDLMHMQEVGLGGLSRFMERDQTTYLPNHNLLYTDKMGMAVGLEARVPYLDDELVTLVNAYPPSWKLDGRVTKAILRDAARGLVPDTIIGRKKAGFGAPYRKWLRYDLAEMWHDLTDEAPVKRRGWFDPKGLARMRALSQTGREDLYMLQWAVLTIELWARAFVDESPVTCPAPGA